MTNAEKFKEIFGDIIKPAWAECSNARTDYKITDEMCTKCDDKWNCKRWLEMKWTKPE